METLYSYGWNDFFLNYHNSHKDSGFTPARVLSLHGFKYNLITPHGEIKAELSGRLLHGFNNEELPHPGDWVYCLEYESLGYIMEVFPRFNALSRLDPGKKTIRQILGANIDYALILQGLDSNFNLMRLERYIVQVTLCGIQPIIILTKADLTDNTDYYRHEVNRLKRDCPLYFCSIKDPSLARTIYKEVLLPEKTCVLLGSSGVGKTSLLNAITGNNLRTVEISEQTGKGKHTTTSRDLFRLRNGSLVMDTPGMREFGVTLEEGNNQASLFPSIDALASDCRYTDCSHTNEKGCAVIEAYENGELDEKIYSSYLKLMKEQRHFAIRMEDKKRLGKQFGKMVREVKDFKQKNDF